MKERTGRGQTEVNVIEKSKPVRDHGRRAQRYERYVKSFE